MPGPEDLVAFLFGYLPMLGWWIGVTLVIGLTLVFARRKGKEPPRWETVAPLLIAAIVSWTFYFAITAERSWAICMLDSEDDGYAERTYLNDFKIGLNDAIRIAKNENYRGNIRFYAAFRAADLLVVTKDDHKIAEVLKNLENASSIQTDFFGTNRLTCGYFIPCHQEGPFEVADLIRRRMQELRSRTITSN
jgi:hypothetical protein